MSRIDPGFQPVERSHPFVKLYEREGCSLISTVLHGWFQPIGALWPIYELRVQRGVEGGFGIVPSCGVKHGPKQEWAAVSILPGDSLPADLARVLVGMILRALL